MAVKQSTISIAASSIFLALAALLGGGVWLVSNSIRQEQGAVAKQAEDLARTAELLQELVTRFHAGVGADLDADAEHGMDDGMIALRRAS
ncbi:MAG: hypothetical protein IT306_01715 [Chloroflexi bacterium]|nr:hypothetical protein [Chloroflexota bacterium]